MTDPPSPGSPPAGRSPSRGFGPRLALWSLAGVGAGLGLGVLASRTGSEWLAGAADLVRPAGTLWLRALEMTVVPLVVTQLLVALVRPGKDAAVGGLGTRALILFVGFLVGGGALAFAATPLLVALVPPGPALAGAGGGAVPQEAVEAAGTVAPGLGEWLVGLVPANPFAAAAQGDLLPLLVATVLFGVAASRLPEGQRTLLASVFRAAADAMMVLVGWVLQFTPIGVLALVWGLALDAGAGVLGVLLSYVVLLCALLLAVTALVYPLTVVVARVPLRRLVRALAPAQLVAVSTQSSLASLPALVEGAEEHLELPDSSTGFVLPLCVAAFKPNQSVYHGFNLLFLAHAFGVQLAPGAMVSFMAFTILMSFGVAGVPRGGSGFRALPLYLAVGMPIEAVVLYEAVKTIPDVFMTLYNVTADMSVATILASSREPGAVIP